jgi:nucleotide-binding universal stress UspA family protein
LFRHILFATDGSDLSDRAAHEVITLAKKLGARLTAIYVMQPDLPRQDLEDVFLPEDLPTTVVRDQAVVALGRVEQLARPLGVEFSIVMEAGIPWEAILKAIDHTRCDLVAMAPQGSSGPAAAVLGGETQRVLMYSKVPVLVIR